MFHWTALVSIDDATASPHSTALPTNHYPTEFHQISIGQYTSSIRCKNTGESPHIIFLNKYLKEEKYSIPEIHLNMEYFGEELCLP
jgi:hypothetical protein